MNTNKYFKNIILAAVAVLCMVTFAACSDDDTDTPELPEGTLPHCTVMLYGCGGGNLDEALLKNLKEVSDYGYTPYVRFTALLKYSDNMQGKNECKGTRQLTMTSKSFENKKFADADFRMDDPQNLADFITDSKKRFPAEHYILVLWNHGDELNMYDQPVSSTYPKTRSLLLDDNTGEALSIFELEEGLRRAGGKLDMVYFDVCLMGMIENLYQIKDYTNYVMSTAHLTSGYGGDYTALMSTLDSGSDFLEAMQKFMTSTTKKWDEGEVETYDLELYDMSRVGNVADCVKECKDVLLNYLKTEDEQKELAFHYFNGDTIEYLKNDEGVSRRSYHYSEGGLLYYFQSMTEEYGTSTDLCSAFARMGSSLKIDELSEKSGKLQTAMANMVVASGCKGLPDDMKSVSTGIHWMDSFEFDAQRSDEYECNSLNELYRHLAFDEVVGWSGFLDSYTRKFVSRREIGSGEMEYYEIDGENE